ncbi:hypothetical protein LR48_Vigan05g077200 [Vigna angularis]|uniref:Uncharacterized protein n=1 Tax=Phaseolus angularis TaxID=3914 RepID=A0A0L9UK70_PHAAN|nr:hypothetical protein LR48_Vigan05g077200 [Vigna angularis]
MESEKTSKSAKGEAATAAQRQFTAERHSGVHGRSAEGIADEDEEDEDKIRKICTRSTRSSGEEGLRRSQGAPGCPIKGVVRHPSSVMFTKFCYLLMDVGQHLLRDARRTQITTSTDGGCYDEGDE